MKPGDVGVIVTRGRFIPVTVIEVEGDTFRVRLGAAPLDAKRLPTADELARREDRIEARDG